MILTFFASPVDPDSLKVDLFKLMEEQNCLGIILNKICSKTATEEIAGAYVEFLQVYLERVPLEQHMHIWFEKIFEPKSLVEACIATICNLDGYHPPWQRLLCMRIISSLFKFSADKELSNSAANPIGVPVLFTRRDRGNRLHFLSSLLYKALVPNIPLLCQALTTIPVNPVLASPIIDVLHPFESNYSKDSPSHSAASSPAARIIDLMSRFNKPSPLPPPIPTPLFLPDAKSVPKRDSKVMSVSIDVNKSSKPPLPPQSDTSINNNNTNNNNSNNNNSNNSSNTSNTSNTCNTTNTSNTTNSNNNSDANAASTNSSNTTNVSPTSSTINSSNNVATTAAPVATIAATPIRERAMSSPNILLLCGGRGDKSTKFGFDTINGFYNPTKDSKGIRQPVEGFTSARLELMLLLCILCVPNEYNPGYPILSIPNESWAVFIHWFFQFKDNNFYLSAFRKLFTLLLRAKEGGEQKLRCLLVQYNFLSFMIDFYRAKRVRCSLNGFILELCNHVRLTADTQKKQAFLPSFLASNNEWKLFLPVLRESTLAQITPLAPVKKKKAGSPKKSGPPSPPFQPIEEKAIDLGSEYASSLGYSNFSLDSNTSTSDEKANSSHPTPSIQELLFRQLPSLPLSPPSHPVSDIRPQIPSITTATTTIATAAVATAVATATSTPQSSSSTQPVSAAVVVN